MKIGITGSAGFIGGYVVDELLNRGEKVVGVDNFSKYGEIKKSYDTSSQYTLYKGDAKNKDFLLKVFKDCDYIVAGAAKIGGIAYFHAYAYDLLSENERIIASTFDAAIELFKKRKLKKIIVISSSMVFESTTTFPTSEEAINFSSPPKSTYGFQKLATEYFAKGAWEQYKLPYTIVRPFNCVGIGELRAQTDSYVKSGNIRLTMSHVVPDLILKTLKGQDPLHILGNGKQVRHYTYGGDLAKGICKAIFSKKAKNQDFNLSSDTSTSVLELAKLIWNKINKNKPFHYVQDLEYTYDVEKRIPDTKRAKKILGFEAKTTLEEVIDIMIPWVKRQIELKTI